MYRQDTDGRRDVIIRLLFRDCLFPRRVQVLMLGVPDSLKQTRAQAFEKVCRDLVECRILIVADPFVDAVGGQRVLQVAELGEPCPAGGAGDRALRETRLIGDLKPSTRRLAVKDDGCC